ncbi:MAG TPA: long-chain fatty acid--CoA ligase [Chloroflexota bacterium]|nr:long-chain fatty acid--CoA ligase [Chloroflexota bacterium]
MMAELPGLRDLAPCWLDRLAALWPDRVALVDPDRDHRFTFQDLRARADATAWNLLQQGVRAGDRVAALMQNSVVMLDLLFACGRLGAVLVPLNWRLSERELAGIIAETEPALLVADDELAPRAAALTPDSRAVRHCVLDVDTLSVIDGPAPPDAGARLSDPWLILFTGGTTGTPKGAVLTHGSMTWNSINTAVSWGLSAEDVGPVFTPMFHTGGFNVFTLPLLMLGGRVILPKRFDAGQALQIIRQERPTILFMVPTMFQLVAEQPGFEEADLSSLRWAISGGAPLPDPTYERWKARVRVFKQGYGLTEAGPNNFATPDCDAVRKRGTVGRLTYFVQARLVDDAGNDVPEGSPGELLLAGPHLCAGYWRRPDATADAIRDGWLHTGDIARRDAEGYYYIVDRKKDMIISGGENIYPTEVEAVLYEHSAVREAAVVGMPDPVWGEAVMAVVSLKPDRSASADELRAHMRRNLARYKVPKTFIIVDELPKSAAGKIVRTEARKLALES